MDPAATTLDRSYAALLRAPSIRRALLAMMLGRIGEAMLPVVLVLTALTQYGSPPLAGVLTSLTVFPGLVAAPLIGAMLDRFGRVRLIRVDYVVGVMLTAVIAASFTAGAPDAALLLALTLVLGITQMFSDAGTRSLFADIVPGHLWERVNAVDSTGYQVAWICGPSIAAILYSIGGPVVAFGSIAASFGLAVIAILALRETPRASPETVHILRLARSGLAYVWRNATLRGMAASVSVTNVCFGFVLVLVPIIVVDHLAADEGVVGLAFAVSGIAGMAGAVYFGRMDTNGRERGLVIGPEAGMTVGAAMLFPVVVGAPDLAVAIAWIVAAMVVFGFSSGAWDIGIFTLRQRRTEPAMVGRAFTISMALNQSGYPIGAALAGWVAASSLDTALLVGVVFGGVGAILGMVLLPRESP